jgi:phosphodiesterase/alkaline phosphatase D-like protein
MKYTFIIILIVTAAFWCGCADSDFQSPDLRNFEVGEITDTSASISWTTDEPATGLVDYGRSTSYGLSVEQPDLMKAHSVKLENLFPGGLYFFRIKVTDENDNTTTSARYDFTTTDSAPPVLSNLTLTAKMDGIDISWDVDELVTARIDFGPTTEYGSFLTDEVLKKSHQFLVEGLDPATTYHFQITLTDRSENVFISGDLPIDTL